MQSCSLFALKVLEGASLLIGAIVLYLLTDALNGDMEFEQEVRDYVMFPRKEFLDFIQNITAKDTPFHAGTFQILEFMSKNSNWEYAACVLQGAMLMLTMGHIFCQFQFSTDALATKFSKFQIVSKILSYCALGGAITLMISITFSEDKIFRQIVEFVIRQMISDGKEVEVDPRLDWLCPYPDSVHLMQNHVVEIVIERRVCEYGFAKYIAMFLFVVECIINGLMYNYAKAEKSRLGRIALARFAAERVPMPLNMNTTTEVTLTQTGNRIAPSQLMANDLPPSYDTVLIINNTKPDIQNAFGNANVSTESNVNANSATAPAIETETSPGTPPPSYAFALLREGSKPA